MNSQHDDPIGKVKGSRVTRIEITQQLIRWKRNLVRRMNGEKLSIFRKQRKKKNARKGTLQTPELRWGGTMFAPKEGKKDRTKVAP